MSSAVPQPLIGNRLFALVFIAVVAYRAPQIIEAWRGGATPVAPPAVATNWKELVPEDRDREQLAGYLEAWSSMIVHTPTLGDYSDARKVADQALQQGGKLTGSLGEFDNALAKRLSTALGGTLDPGRTDLEPLAKEFALIAGELR